MANSQEQDSAYDTALAIIGMSGRFPGAQNVDTFWQNIAAGVKSIRHFTDEELLAAGEDPAVLAQPNFVKAGTVLEGVDRFDASFFKFNPREVEVMDPQHRLFLECAWEALEDAAYDPETYKDLIGVFAGSAFSTYLLNNIYSNPEIMELVGKLQASIGNDRDSLSSTVSYKLNLRGPSFAVQTFCSTSLVAVHLACQSLLNYECDMALAGGVAVNFPQESGYFYEEGGIVSPDGECRTFDAKAQGSVMGNGIGVVTLKRYHEAVQDGDHIYAVIRGSAMNNDGSVRVSYTAPGLGGQTEVIVHALSNAGVPVETISYIEAHGTATMLGDSVELAAMKKAFALSTQKKQFCAIGSVKPNIGHLDRASGVTGLIKTSLALTHKLLPPSLNFEQANADVDLANSPFYVNTSLSAWNTADGTPRRAGVSSFGIGGTNAHVVLEEAPELEPSSPSRSSQLLLLSAKTATALETATANLHGYLLQHPEANLPDVAYTLQVGRSAFNHRRVLVCRDRDEAIVALNTSDSKNITTTYQVNRDRGVAFLLPGLGDQYVGMAQELYQQETTFREIVDQCCTLLQSRMNIDLRTVLYPENTGETHIINGNGHSKESSLDLRALLGRNGNTSSSNDQLKQTVYAQPILFIIEYALAQLWIEWGVKPQALIGYSLGEYVAACLAGVLSLEDALMLVARRAQMIQQLPAGAMLAINLSEQGIQPYLTDQVCLAAVNATNTCVLAGPIEAITQLESHLSQQGIACRRVETTHAFHSSMLQTLAEPLAKLVSNIALHEPQIPYLSNVTGTWITAEQATDPAYWAQHMCQTVRFAQGIAHLLADTEYVLLEVGQGQSLSSFVRQHPACTNERSIFSSLPSIFERQSDHAYLLHTLGKLWLAGVTIDWSGFYINERRLRLSLPTYPFERQRYWIEEVNKKASKVGAIHKQPEGKKSNLAEWFYLPRWEKTPISSLPASAHVQTQKSHFLVFMDTCGLAEQVAKQLQQQGHAFTCVLAGEKFARIDGQTFTIRPHEQTDYLALCKELLEMRQMPRTILHCWSVTDEASTLAGPAYFKTKQEAGFYSLLYLTQALGMHMYDEPMQMVVISNHIQAVTAQDRLQPEKSPILGACKVIPQENLNIVCRSIDLDDWSSPEIIQQLIVECSSPVSDLIVAYRGQVRYVQSYQATYLKPVAPSFRPQGVYLITGGLGGIGPVLASYLAKTVQARLILVGRSALPPRENWQDWLASHDAADNISRKIRQIQAIEGLGSEVMLVQADVADVAQMEAVIQQTYERFGALHGVIHAAGITTPSAFRAIQEIGMAECETHFRPKVHGLYTLEQVLRGRELDFCLLFSSVSAVLGGLGFIAYSAANMYMDAFTYKYNQTAAKPWICVNWDTWQVKEDVHGVLGATVAEYEMTPDEGTEAVVRILASGNTHIVNSTGDLHARIQQWIRLESLDAIYSASNEETTGKTTSSKAAKLSNAGDYERKIAEIWQQVLGVQQVGLYDNFFDLGGNSLVALQVISKLKKAFHVQIPAVALFEAPTISSLVKYLLPVSEEPETDIQGQIFSQRRTQARRSVGQQDIAIIGMTGRFPGATNIEQFWQNLRDGVESVTFFTDEELLAAGIDARLLQDPNYVKARPIIDDIDKFDANFFGYSPREAELTDPQHRLFMECSWEALEMAGYDASTYNGLIGVFGGTNISTYLLGMAAQPDVIGSADDYQLVIGNDKDSLTTSVSYKFNLKGPSFAVQTFCSTSLVATHLASQSLLNGECDIALAGGVSIRVPSKAGHLYQEGGMESPDGHCRTFDAQAKGGMFGDGVGVVVLKRLSDALEDGDYIHAVIKGSAVNNDGSLKVSYTAPSVVGQSEVVLEAIQSASIDVETIGYIEAHGTATELGDPIEVASLTKAFQTQTSKTGYCAIGSVKTNIGHLDRAAGVSGLIKTVLSLQHGQIPPSLHYQSPNPEIDFEHSPFYVNTKLSPWKSNGTPRRAGINSLGLGGTNVHVIVEEAPIPVPSSPARPWQLLLLSARTPTALEAATHNLGIYLQQHAETNLADVAFTLQTGRKKFEHRRMLLCRSREEASEILQQTASTRTISLNEQRTDRPVAFLFPGLGEQTAGMAQELYQQEAAFRETIDRCCQLLKTRLGVDLREVLFPEEHAPNGHNGHTNGKAKTNEASLDLKALLGRNGHTQQNGTATGERLKQTAIAQPAIFVIEYALAQLLMHWGVKPQAMIGYSLGEYVAACLAGVLSLEDALTLVARRAQLIQQSPRGAMVAVALAEEAAQTYLSEHISLAVINAPNTCVLAGPIQYIEQVEERLAAQEIAYRRVETTHAFHSTMLEPLSEGVTELVSGVTLHAPQIPYISNVSGTWITAEQATDPNYWAQHMCQTVRFADGIGHLLQETEYVLLEVGPGQSLNSFVKQHPACGSQRMHLVLSTLPSVYERQTDDAYLLNTLGRLWLVGVNVDWTGFYAGERRQRLPLPTYPFERQRYWIETSGHPARSRHSIGSSADTPETVLSDLKKEALADWFYLPGWKHSAPSLPVVSDSTDDKHCWLVFIDTWVSGRHLVEQLAAYQQNIVTILPGAAYTKQSETLYTINPVVRADYETLLKDLSEHGKIPNKIIHSWVVASEETPHNTEKELAVVLDKGFYSLLALAQALGDVPLDHCHIVVISNDVHNVTGNELLSSARATVIGPCKVIPQEYPTISCQSIDISLPAVGSWQEETLIQQLLGELTTEVRDPVIAFRGNRRWVQTFEPVRLSEEQTQQSRLREGGVYLITGGLGGIGLAMAEYLARSVHARLILTARTALPPRSEWSTILETQGDATGFVQQIRKVQTLEALGSEVLVLQADVSSEPQMRAVIQQTLSSFGTLQGVLHAAGVPGIGLMQLKTPEVAARVLAPKVMGTLVLERVLQDIPLDFLVLFSSITSTTGGGPGQVDYCAANAFLDSYAQRHFAEHGMTVAINWGEWQWNAWEAGLAGYDPEAQAFFKENRRRFGISFEDGTEALRRILSSRLPQVVVSTQDFRVLVELSKNYTAETMLQKARQSKQTRTIHARPDLASEYAAPRNELERHIANVWEDLLGIDGVGIEDNFFELGGNSLVGVDLIARLRKELQIANLPSYVLFEAPSVSAMAQYIEQNKTTEVVEARHDRGERRRESLKQRMLSEARRTR